MSPNTSNTVTALLGKLVGAGVSDTVPSAFGVKSVSRTSRDEVKKKCIRIESSTRQLIDDAAAILGKTRTEFMVESARLQAIDVLLDQRLFRLDAERYDAFMAALDDPPGPGPKLRSLLRRAPAWRE